MTPTLESLATAIWERLQRFELDDPEAAFSFSDRLARENDWTKEHALRAIAEYKRFLLLLCVAGHPCTPSDAVDQVWHLHLLYTESYWRELCGEVLRRELHHGPTRGGAAEAARYGSAYEATLASYRRLFEEEPPLDLWPPARERFRAARFVRVDRARTWCIPRFSRWFR
ncbi:MAG: hypothetical protein IPN34_12920 [Planctomycetes bacterium]|nr:hypothetical protein [Planctomycetota bacterium]